ncbi:arabinosyltransferase domain-containing protein [Actinomycetospora soli]|uniref:arabinosyltransferase domain-containing protein n=1 Tax=Actinomycetospora soli TaxID=2893887 RepID=UPI001E59B7B9|nr:arabinosyltransferase domain-containing protein [Actinomycetospora soli]MCD2188439.1 arabinosyltransferase domain-containing protein [Actinomycetospora soli]
MSTSGRWIALVAGAVSVLAALAFPFAPVTQPVVTYSWPTSVAPTGAAIPMLPYQPQSLVVTVTADAVRAAAPGTVLFSTAPPVTDPLAEPIQGLTVRTAADGVEVTSGGRTFAPVPAGSLRVDSSVDATTLAVDGREVARADGDVRPAVAGAFTGAATSAGLSFSAVGDTRFQTTASGWKVALGVVAVLAFLVALGALWRASPGDRKASLLSSSGRNATSSGGPRARVADLGVVGGLLLWQVIGPLTVDDGYIAGIVRSLGQNGQVGTVFRWLNSPETPFGWFYEVLAVIAGVGPAPFWLRLPATVLGIVGWFLLTRSVLPRLTVPAAPLLAGVVYLAWWLPYDLGVRPEPWVLVGSALVFVLVERAIERSSAVALVGALAIAGVTLAVTPTGLMAFVPLLVGLAALRPLLKPATLVVGIAALGLTLVLVYADQTWASVLDSVGIRTLIGGDRPWTDEYVRYASLLTVGDAEGNLGRRAPVLLLVLAFAALAFGARDRLTGTSRRVVVVTLLSLVSLAFTPTKWTHHFGAFAVLGTATTLLALDAWRRSLPDDEGRRLRRASVGVAAAAGVSGLTLAGYNQWHWISSYAITWSTLSPQLGGVRFADAVLVVGAAVAVVLAVLALRRSGEPATGRQQRRFPATAWAPGLAIGVVVLVVAIEVLSFARTAYQRRDSYTLASDSIASLTGGSCGIADRLRVERDPLAGLLPSDGPGALPTTGPDGPSMAGADLPGWRGPDVTTGWYRLPDRDSATYPPGEEPDPPGPVVVTLTGPVAAGDVVAEFRAPDGEVTRVPLDEGATQYAESASVDAPRSRDLRLDPGLSADYTAIRLVSARDTPETQGFSAPRIARLVPWNEVLTPGTPAAVDWPGAFLFPCTPFPTLRDGVAELPGWRVSTDARSEAQSGYISYTASQGGPWLTARALVRQVRYAVYLPGLPLTDIASLERWVPTTPLVPPGVTSREVSHSGFSTPGPLSIGES